MTFLEYVANELFGPPISSGRTSNFYCPFHGGDSFYTLPETDEHPKAKFKCHGCGRWGDEADLMRFFYPREKYPQHYERLITMKANHDILNPSTSGQQKSVSRIKVVFDSEEERNVELAFCALQDLLRTDDLSEKIRLISASFNIPEKKLRDYYRKFQAIMFGIDQRHLMNCRDPKCDAEPCLRRRGELELYMSDLSQRKAEHSRVMT